MKLTRKSFLQHPTNCPTPVPVDNPSPMSKCAFVDSTYNNIFFVFLCINIAPPCPPQKWAKNFRNLSFECVFSALFHASMIPQNQQFFYGIPKRRNAATTKNVPTPPKIKSWVCQNPNNRNAPNPIKNRLNPLNTYIVSLCTLTLFVCQQTYCTR